MNFRANKACCRNVLYRLPSALTIGYSLYKKFTEVNFEFGKTTEIEMHHYCTVLCIPGGIPPVLQVQNEKEESNYYLIVGPNGEKMNDAVQDFVAEPVSIEARTVQQGGWIILYSGKESIKRISMPSCKTPMQN